MLLFTATLFSKLQYAASQMGKQMIALALFQVKPFAFYVFPRIMHDNTRIHSSKAPAVIPWKELYLTRIGHRIFPAGSAENMSLKNYDFSDPGVGIIHA